MADTAPIKTDWFDGSEKPVNVGVYEREYPARVMFSKWDGVRWFWPRNSPEEAAAETILSAQQPHPECLRWRGIVPEFEGCVPVACVERNSCNGCAFAPAVSDKCLDSRRALSCVIERITWRPRSEVQE